MSKPKDEYIRRYTTISAMLDILRRKELPLLNPENWDDRNDRHFMNIYKSRKNLTGLYAMCATNCDETYHHWRVFTAGADGACLELRRIPLETALAALPKVRYNNVTYLKFKQIRQLGPNDIDRLPFVKRWGFAPEEEYRIIFESDEPQAATQPIELPINLIGSVYLNPWLPTSIADSVVDTVRSIPGCEQLTVRRSYLIDHPKWKDAGDRVAGVKPSQAKKPLKLKIQNLST